MKIRFNLNYHTIYGQRLGIKIQHHPGGEEIIYLEYTNNGNWYVERDYQLSRLDYLYFIENEFGIKTFEWNTKSIDLAHYKTKQIQLFDFFSFANFPEFYFNTRPFQLSRLNSTFQESTRNEKSTHKFSISAPLFNENWELHLLGNCEEIGNWKTNKSVKLKEISFGSWEIELDLNKVSHVIQYKYVIKNKTNGEVISFENGENRVIHPNIEENQINLIQDVYFKYPENLLWKKAAVAIPVFSLKTENSFGVGEFLDIKKFADFSKQAGFGLIQLLPINDTTANYSWTDSYPYAAISVYALHPIFINLENLQIPLNKTETTAYKKLQKQLNEEKLVNYEEVIKNKWIILRKYFTKHIKSILNNEKFQNYLTENQNWIYAYSAFCVLRDENNTPDFTKWKTNSSFIKDEISSFFNPENERFNEVILHAYVQYELHIQLTDAINYVHSLGISVKGDLPIGIYRNSVEAWTEPEYFGMDFQAGAPPDDFAVLGQNWEFPTYNWEKMKEGGYLWWKKRFANMSQYFDAFRIDHILGFFRIWRIPYDARQGILGYFYPAIPFSKGELWERGVSFQYERFVLPYITHEILENYFKTEKDKIFSKLFYEENGIIKFKEVFNTQRKIESLSKNDPWIKKHKENLFELLANVLFLEEDRNGEKLYHPRFFLYQIPSYHALNDENKKNLYDVYVHYFFERQENLWYEKGMEKLPFLKKTTEMLTCGEDLGLVPACVPKVMNDLSILSLQVQRMPSGNQDFSDPQQAPYLSVVCASSHDTSTLRMWWEEDEKLTQKYYNQQLKMQGTAPKELNPELSLIIFKQHLYSKAMLAVFPIQDIFSLDYKLYVKNKDAERINIPAVFPHYWKYRMHISIEELMENHQGFIHKVAKEIENSGR